MGTSRVWIAAAVVIAGCHGGGDGGTPDGASGDADLAGPDGPSADAALDAGPPTCGFDDAAASWMLPPSASTRAFGAFFTASSAEGTFSTLDLDGDQRPDLVFTRKVDDDTVGTTRWLVHHGIEGGFAADAVEWQLPGSDGPFRYAEYVASTFPAYDLLDLDGDARPELIVTFRNHGSPVGNTRWDVYRNQGDGFAATSTPWSLPIASDAYLFLHLRDRGSWCGDYETFDIDGDGRPDLVVTDTCAGGYPTRWLVARNTGAGFDAVSSVWTIPFPADHDGCSWPHNLVHFARADLDGDSRPDLVITASCTTEAIGRDHWLVHHNTGAGFTEDPQLFTLPGGPEDFWDVTGRTDPVYMTTDLVGDAGADLVVLSRGGTDLGTVRWIVHRNDGDGFAAPQDWCLPAGYGDGAFSMLPPAQAECPAWTLLDLDGDGVPGLAIAKNHCIDPDSTVGTDRWLVHGD